MTTSNLTPPLASSAHPATNLGGETSHTTRVDGAQAVCACGWRGEQRHQPGEAHADAGAHLLANLDESEDSGAGALLEDPNGWEEASEYTRRQQLGLRAVYFPDTQEPGSHPDQRPCPPWCAIGASEYDHEIEPGAPFLAEHSTEPIGIAASVYRGTHHRGARTPGVSAATIETHMRQLGQGGQRIEVYLRQERDGEECYTKQLALGVTDAAELATVLSYLVAQADAGEALRSF